MTPPLSLSATVEVLSCTDQDSCFLAACASCSPWLQGHDRDVADGFFDAATAWQVQINRVVERATFSPRNPDKARLPTSLRTSFPPLLGSWPCPVLPLLILHMISSSFSSFEPNAVQCSIHHSSAPFLGMLLLLPATGCVRGAEILTACASSTSICHRTHSSEGRQVNAAWRAALLAICHTMPAGMCHVYVQAQQILGLKPALSSP